MSAKSPLLRIRTVIGLGLIGLGLGIAQTLQFFEFRNGVQGFSAFCKVGVFDCHSIDASPYAELFWGVPLSAMAAAWFLLTIALGIFAVNPFWRREAMRALLITSGIGLVVSVAYLYVMVAILKTYCLLCLGVDAVNLALFGIVLSLKSEWHSPLKMEVKKWKTFAAIGLGSAVIAVFWSKAMGPDPSQGRAMSDEIQNILQSEVIPVRQDERFLSVGPMQAPVTLVKFSDFQCPHCRAGAFSLHPLMKRMPNQVRLVFRNFPLDGACNRMVQRSMHPYACEAAKIAICAQAQGKFQMVYEVFFERQAEMGPGKLEKWAIEGGLNAEQLKSCMADPETSERLSKDIEEGIQLGVQSTPTFFINGHKVEGAPPPSVWIELAEKLIKSGGS